MSDVRTRFIDHLREGMERGQVCLPALPDIALKVRELLGDPDVQMDRVGRVIATDPALVSRLISIANSAAYSTGGRAVTELKQALSRLGSERIKGVVTALVMQQLFQRRALESMQRQLQALWKHSTAVAALSAVIARQRTSLSPDEAMLGGLVHDIGKLHILVQAELFPELFSQPAALGDIMSQLHAEVGAGILRLWNFADYLVMVASEHDNLDYAGTGAPDFVDVVLVANLHSVLGTDHAFARRNWGEISAFQRLGLTPPDSIAMIKQARGDIAQIQTLLGA
ncbi:MAG: HDOD domain-containing protein [Chromatiales bacterium]|jgi:putative nucleotidyltransferase with HDIG domain|nr:HDOD domain-containing protein [Chromatiales bacterium]MDX9767392.1 HDOD domain-containing protein [Ectothiorhodospiraceae bacterium]